uniref:DNA 5'-3' helicase n=1 Tax=Chondria sp. (in: red algae) TaxID=1982705 RepID=A0A1Z1MEF1_9FLOR|nr:Replication helicase subunit [Chondria sp. (in: red algae)]
MNTLFKHRSIPQNYLAEEILLGSIIIYPKIINYTKNIIKKEYFFLEFNEIIYIALIEHNIKENNILHLFYKLKSSKILQQVGGYRKIISIMRQSQIFINSSNIRNYIEKLIQSLHTTYIKRLVIQYGYNIIKLGYLPLFNNRYIYKKILFYTKFLENQIEKYNEKNLQVTNFKDLLSLKLLEIQNPTICYRNSLKASNKVIKSGLNNLDDITNGLPRGNLIIIAGRPSAGKTSLAINIAYNLFFYQKVSVCLFSLEMSSTEILNKIVCISCKINITTDQHIQLTKIIWHNIAKVCKKLLENNIYINDKYNLGIHDIEYITKSLKRKNINIHLIIIDYLQLIEFSLTDIRQLNRSQELGYITRKLKLLAQLLELPIIVLSQLNRNIEIRHDKEPILSDLKESGCIYYKNNIDNILNDINFYNINYSINTLTNLKYIWCQKVQKKYELLIEKSNIYICSKNIFQFLSPKLKLELTYNHKSLSRITWIQVNAFMRLTTVISICIKRIYIIIYKVFVSKINYLKYFYTYDINFNNQFHFSSNKIVLHNSIEQDSDIIMILHNKITNNQYNKEKIIDIKICKNRNGQTGSCEVLFDPETVTFKSINDKIIT